MLRPAFARIAPIGMAQAMQLFQDCCKRLNVAQSYC
jgi:hypothetical protein